MKSKSHAYMKVIEWSEEDQCFVGSAPPLIGRCCHGDTEEEVHKQLTVIVDEWIEEMEKDGKSLPEASASKEYSGKFVIRVSPEIHKAVAIRAMMERRSLNSFVQDALERSCLVPSEPTPRSPRRKKQAA